MFALGAQSCEMPRLPASFIMPRRNYGNLDKGSKRRDSFELPDGLSENYTINVWFEAMGSLQFM